MFIVDHEMFYIWLKNHMTIVYPGYSKQFAFSYIGAGEQSSSGCIVESRVEFLLKMVLVLSTSLSYTKAQ